MSFWNFIGGFALFSFFDSLFSQKNRHRKEARDILPDKYSSKNIADRIALLNSRIDNLENRLEKEAYRYPDYDELQDELEELETELDDMCYGLDDNFEHEKECAFILDKYDE